MTPIPYLRRGNTIEFDDGTSVDVLDMAEEWAAWHDRISGTTCAAADRVGCDREATTTVIFWGYPIGRVCDLHAIDVPGSFATTDIIDPEGET